MEENLPAAKIEIRSPCTHNTWEDGKYVSYEIRTETDHSCFHLKHSSTRRRYSEFVWLRNQLKKHHPIIKAPELPSRKLIHMLFNWSDDDFLENRRKGLEDFLYKLQKEPLYLSDSTFHLFLQTDLTCEQITDYLEGRLPDSELNKVWQAGGMQGDLLGLDLNSRPEWGGDKLRVDSQASLRQSDQGLDSGLGGDNSSIGDSSVSSQEDRLHQWQGSSAAVQGASPHFSINGGEEEDSSSEETQVRSAPTKMTAEVR